MGNLSTALLPVANSLKVALGLGFVIFIHELGHFLLAKWNGVKVEKFSIGFGPTIFGFRRAETEYVLAAIPLGGFVKMLGENPEDEESKTTDPRAFHNKSVGARMAIICAGVIMNIIFGVVCNAFVYTQPREETAPKVGVVFPGSPAYEAGLKAGDEILEIDGQTGIGFNDLTRKVILSGAGQSLSFVVKREKEEKPLILPIKPRREGDQDRPVIGVLNARNLEVAGFLPPAGLINPPTYPLPDAKLRETTTDTIKAVAVEGEKPVPIASAEALQDLMSRNSDKTLVFSIERHPDADSSKETATSFEFKLPPNHFVDFGLHLNLSPILAIQKDSLAEKAGFQVGDLIVQFAGQDDFDPMRLPYLWYKNQGKPVTIVVERKGPSNESKRVTLTATPGASPPWFESYPLALPLDISGLGICYNVVPRVHSVLPNSPAAKAGIKSGDVINAISIPPPPPIADATADADKKKPAAKPQEYKFDTESAWIQAFYAVQASPLQPIKFTINNSPTVVEIQPVPDPHWFNPTRGLFLQGLSKMIPPRDLAGAIRGGLTKTYTDVLDIYTMLRGLFQQRIGPANLGGPITIAKIAYKAAGMGWTDLIGFLGAMSINLAVLNFLPIPPLDGGQMMFLLIEKVRGRPLPESVLIGAIYIGLPLVLLVMVFATYQDIFRIVKDFIP